MKNNNLNYIEVIKYGFTGFMLGFMNIPIAISIEQLSNGFINFADFFPNIFKLMFGMFFAPFIYWLPSIFFFAISIIYLKSKNKIFLLFGFLVFIILFLYGIHGGFTSEGI